MSGIFARKALLADGWADNVRIDIEAGRIAAIAADARATVADREFGIVIPGLANAHSHAFQRVLAGHTEERGPANKDNFWTWRSRMYGLQRDGGHRLYVSGRISLPAQRAGYARDL